MRNFKQITNPYFCGIRPKAFLSNRVEMLREEQMNKPSGKVFNPKWTEQKKI